jgi:hypothetical protein
MGIPVDQKFPVSPPVSAPCIDPEHQTILPSVDELKSLLQPQGYEVTGQIVGRDVFCDPIDFIFLLEVEKRGLIEDVVRYA